MEGFGGRASSNSQMPASSMEDSRRFSIDSFRGASSTLSTTATPLIPTAQMMANRFNTISENEFEEPDINQKSLELEMNGNLNRLSILQTRNQRVPAHLKSSYALEMNLPTANELAIRGEQAAAAAAAAAAANGAPLKENRPPLPASGGSKSNLFVSANQKRRFDENTKDTSSPPRKTNSHTVRHFSLSFSIYPNSNRSCFLLGWNSTDSDVIKMDKLTFFNITFRIF